MEPFFQMETVVRYTGYLVWVNDEQYWHRTVREAQARAMLVQRGGKDTFVRGLKPPFVAWWPSQPPGRRAAC
jgi:hypothetical protein